MTRPGHDDARRRQDTTSASSCVMPCTPPRGPSSRARTGWSESVRESSPDRHTPASIPGRPRPPGGFLAVSRVRRWNIRRGGSPAHGSPAHGSPAHGSPAHGSPAQGRGRTVRRRTGRRLRGASRGTGEMDCSGLAHGDRLRCVRHRRRPGGGAAAAGLPPPQLGGGDHLPGRSTGVQGGGRIGPGRSASSASSASVRAASPSSPASCGPPPPPPLR